MEQGAVEIVVGMMNTHPKDNGIGSLAVRFLGELLLQDKKSGRAAHQLLDCGGVRSLVSLMQRFPTKNEIIQAFGTSILILAANSDKALEPVAEQNGIPAIIGALKRVTDRADFQVIVCRLILEALRTTSCVDDLQQQIQHAGALPAFIGIIRQYENGTSVGPEEPIVLACEVIGTLAGDRDSVKHELVRRGGIPVISMTAMHHHKDNPYFFAASMQTVRILCNPKTQAVKCKTAFVKGGAIPTVLAVTSVKESPVWDFSLQTVLLRQKRS